MKIIHVYKDYFPVLGGIENYTRILAEAQAAAGHDVTVLVCATGLASHTERLNGVRVIKAGRLATVASMPLSLRQPAVLRRIDADIVHVQSPYPLGEAADWLLARRSATVITYHSDVVRQKGLLRLYGPVLKRVLRAADAIIATSPPYVESSPFLAPLGDRTTVIPHGIDVARFAPAAEPRSDGRRVLFVGRLRYYKGVDTLVQAMADVPDAELTLVGDGPERPAIEARIAALGLGERVAIADDVSDEALPQVFRDHDLFVLPSNARSEAFGIVLLEAMASGLPCVATELDTGTSWVVQDGVTGHVVPPLDPPAMAEAIRAILDDDAPRLAMGRAARERVDAEFTRERMIARVERVYESVLDDRRR